MRTSHIAKWRAFICCAVCFPTLLGAEIPAQALANLRSQLFRERESAQEELLQWGRKNRELAKSELLREARSTPDPEARKRCLSVLESLVIDDYSKEGEGYIGIAMRDELVEKGDLKPHHAIRVTMIRPGSPGEQAGLLINDLIVALNDVTWVDQVGSPSFQGEIRKLKPGAKVELRIVRGEESSEVVVILGRRPLHADEMMLGGPNQNLEAREEAAKSEYFRNWMNQRK